MEMARDATIPVFRFNEGDIVAIKEDRPDLGLVAGDTGKIWALYALEPPAYEITFRGPSNEPFDLTLTEDELMSPRICTPKAVPKRPRKRAAA